MSVLLGFGLLASRSPYSPKCDQEIPSQTFKINCPTDHSCWKFSTCIIKVSFSWQFHLFCLFHRSQKGCNLKLGNWSGYWPGYWPGYWMDKRVLITGGSSGIGLATAKVFWSLGAKVIITCRSHENLAQVSREYDGKFDVVPADVSSLSDLDRLFSHIQQKYSHLNFLFANAGVAQFRPTTEVTSDFFNHLFDVNVKGLFFTVSKTLPLFEQGSTVVLNASVVSEKGIPGSSVYSATKAAVRSFARTWTSEISPSHVRFNVISPGPIETPIYQKMNLSENAVEEMKKGMVSTVPMQRFGTADEVARAVLFLASPDSSYIAGVDLRADGGFSQV